MFRNLLLFLFFILCFGPLGAQSLWSDVNEATITLTGERRIVPQHYRTVRLDLDAVESLMGAAPERFKPEAADNQTLLTLPTPDGGWQTFQLFESPVMDPALQAQYPEIRCYTGIGLDDPTATLKCDLTPWGFHGMVLSNLHSTIFIDPYSQGDRDNYVVYFKKDYLSKKAKSFVCGVEDGEVDPHLFDETPDAAPDFQGDCQLRRYRLALACTGEYATFHGGTKLLVLAAMNTTMNRVNGVYETDLDITMQIIANNDLLIFLNANTDPYTNNDGATMLGQNITTCNNVIGIANYDIGHVFSTGGGGIAGLSVVCTANKARGVTGGPSPVGDGFDIDYVAHEMGHQFGANHTQNNNCNRVAAASMEPGSASTIMGYAGICSPNVQSNSDDYFHAISLQEIGNFVTGASHTCPVILPTGNHAPVVNGGADYNIPKSTPFSLTAVGSDQDNDPVTYCWEQMDPQFATMPPVSTSATGPLFRSYKGTASPTRWFPRLPDLVSNTNSQWEELPGVARTMKFRVTIRDNHAGAGCTEEDDVVLTVSGTAGPFVVSAPNTNVLWNVGETQTVTWNVASTNLAPINCANVKILLSTDGGFTYPITLLASTPNDGTADVVVPNNVSNTCRVMVQSVGNVFFDISNVNFRIQLPPVPTFTLAAAQPSVEVCAGSPATITLDLSALAGFNNPVDIAVTGEPAGSTVTISPNPVTPPASATVTISGLTSGMAGDYTLTITGTSGAITQTTTVDLSVLPGAPTDFAELSLPADGSTEIPLSTTLEWEAVPFAGTYLVEVASNPGFDAGSIVYSGTVTDATAAVTGLQGNTVYYWRVKAVNGCGDGGFSATAAFQTANLNCNVTFNSTDVPKEIDPASVNTAVSTLNVPLNTLIADVNVSVQVDHSWIGDLDATVSSPSGTDIQLFDRPGVPETDFGCDGNNINVVFDDEAASTAADLEATCGANPGISGPYQPITPLSTLDTEPAQGTWTLSITDNYPEDGGSITGWSVTFCVGGDNLTATLATNSPLTVVAGGSGEVATANLEAEYSGTAAQAVYTLLVLPEFGQLLLDGTPLGVGGTFTQADIDAGLLVYVNGGSAATDDIFQFDLVDQNNGAWLHGGLFNIVILQNTLVVSATQTQGLSCNGDNSGEITVDVAGGTPPLSYSLNGGPEQDENIFGNLPAGTYTVVVSDDNGFSATTNEVVIEGPAAIDVSSLVLLDDVTVTATGGTGVLEYSLDGQNFQSSNVFENLPNGVYTVTVQDENGCTATTTAIVAVNTLLIALDIETNIACNNGTDGAVLANVAGGTPPLTFSLNGGPAQDDPLFANLPAGDYSVVVTDSEGFTATTNTVTLNNPNALDLSASTTGDVVTLTATGGTGMLTYSLDGQNFQGSNVFEGVANGVYTATVKDENGCTASVTAIVAVNSLLAALEVEATVTCAGGSNGALFVTVGGGEQPYEYSLDGSVFQSENTFTGLPAGSYQVTVRDNQGFTATTNTVDLTAPPAIDAMASAALNVITVTATGGTGTLEYSLDGVNFQPGNTFGGLANGTYTITIRDENGCTATASATVDVAPLEFVSIDVTPIACNGGTSTVTVNATGGVPPYEYSLDGGAYQSGNVLNNVAGGNHEITVRDAAGTTIATNGFVVLEPAALTAAITVTGNDVSDVDVTGGTPPYSFQTDAPSYMDLPNGTYGFTVTDANGCTATTTFTGNVQALTIVNVNLAGPFCAGSADGVLTVEAAGGEPPYEYSLNDGPWQSSSEFTGIAAGFLNIRVRDAAGTIEEINIVVSEPTPVVVSVAVSGNDAIPTVTGGAAPYTWAIAGQPDLIDLPNGTYTLTATDANGCTATTTFEVNYTPLSATFNLIGDPCLANSFEITANGGVPPYQYSTNNGPFQDNPQFLNLPAGTYEFSVKDAIGEIYDLPVVVVVSPPLSASASAVLNTVTVTATGGTGLYLYNLNGVTQISPVFENVPEGTYTVTVTDNATGCTATTQVTVIIIATVEPGSAWGLVVSPNPSQGVFQLALHNAPASAFRADVFDAAGRLVLTRSFDTTGGAFSTSIDLQDVPQGLYLLRLSDDKNWGTVRLSVVR